MSQTTIDPKDVENFTNLADGWWDEKGPFKPLHEMNPCRLGFIKQTVTTYLGEDFSKYKLLDVGCGGGILAEPLCRMGFQITGLDAGLENIKAAKDHAEAQGLPVTYIHTSVEEHATGKEVYDVITCLELIEHVSDPQLLIQSCAQLLKPGGLLIVSTLNRTLKSMVLGIGVAEYVLRWVPRGTHQWSKFLKPSQIARLGEPCHLNTCEIKGMTYNPITGQWALSDDLDMNYLMLLVKV